MRLQGSFSFQVLRSRLGQLLDVSSSVISILYEHLYQSDMGILFFSSICVYKAELLGSPEELFLHSVSQLGVYR